ncbi:MAG: hypothetical protein MJZ71_04050 [Bacteroidales bacterium]|nr:hypothetical protein [Bacteroidales bacterium]
MTEAEFLFKKKQALGKIKKDYYEALNTEWDCLYSCSGCKDLDDGYDHVLEEIDEELSPFCTEYDIENVCIKYPCYSFPEPERFILWLGVEEYNKYKDAKAKAEADFKKFKAELTRKYTNERKKVEGEYARRLDNDRELKKKIDEYNNILKELGVEDDERLEPLVKAGVDRYELKYTFARLEGDKLIKKTAFGYEFIDDEDNHKVAAFVICANWKWNLVVDKTGETVRYNYAPFNKIFALQKGTLKSKSRSVGDTDKNFEKYFK